MPITLDTMYLFCFRGLPGKPHPLGGPEQGRWEFPFPEGESLKPRRVLGQAGLLLLCGLVGPWCRHILHFPASPECLCLCTRDLRLLPTPDLSN